MIDFKLLEVKELNRVGLATYEGVFTQFPQYKALASISKDNTRVLSLAMPRRSILDGNSWEGFMRFLGEAI